MPLWPIAGAIPLERARRFWCKVEDAQRPRGWNSGKMSKRSSLDELFKGRHFLAEVIVVSVRWYLEYKLSSRDISRLMAERLENGVRLLISRTKLTFRGFSQKYPV
jgi:hypothetical protein